MQLRPWASLIWQLPSMYTNEEGCVTNALDCPKLANSRKKQTCSYTDADLEVCYQPGCYWYSLKNQSISSTEIYSTLRTNTASSRELSLSAIFYHLALTIETTASLTTFFHCNASSFPLFVVFLFYSSFQLLKLENSLRWSFSTLSSI